MAGDWRKPNQMSPFELEMMSQMLFGGKLRDRLSTFNVDWSDQADLKPKSDDEQAYEKLGEKLKKHLLESKQSALFEDVVGNETAHEALRDAIETPVKHRELYAHYGCKPGRGVLLYGPPGCGKTLFAKAAVGLLTKLHGERDAKGKSKPPIMVRVSGPEIQSPFVGVTEEIIRNIFAFARLHFKLKKMPLIVFIDEADALLPARNGQGRARGIHSWEEANVATFLAEMDGLEGSGAFVLLATNRPETLDEAVLRDGRIDRKIKIERPAEVEAFMILNKALEGVPLVQGESSDTLAAAAVEELFSPFRRLSALWLENGTRDFLTLGKIISGAMLVGLVERAKSLAMKRDLKDGSRTGVNASDFRNAIDAIEFENTLLDHGYAISDWEERIGLKVQRVEKIPPNRARATSTEFEAAE